LLITALPIGDDFILELIKNVTDSVIIDDSYYQRFNGLTDRYNNLAYQDILTGLYNRRYVDERLQKDISASIHKQQPLSMIFLDIDNLKEINDHYGHAFGDSVLKEVSQLLVRSTRESSDWAARYGGDEFLICLNNTSDDDAFEIAERIRTEITTLVILQNENIKTSASLGVYSSGSKEITAAELISMTDAKMYQAKRYGKNQTAK